MKSQNHNLLCYTSPSFYVSLYTLRNDRIIINRHNPLNAKILRAHLQNLMRLALVIVIRHVFFGRELGFRGEGEALAAGVFEERTSFEGEDVGFAVLGSGCREGFVEVYELVLGFFGGELEHCYTDYFGGHGGGLVGSMAG